MPQGNRRCDQCDYYQEVDATVVSGFGGCRRYPSQYFNNTQGRTPLDVVRARWPSVQPDDWCGEWKQLV